MVRCPVHGRVYEKDAGCPVCAQEAAMPRAPGKPAGASAVVTPEEAAASGRKFMMTVLLGVVVVGGGGALLWSKFHKSSEERAMAARDSLRAIAAGPARPDTTQFAAASDLSPIRRARALRGVLLSVLGGRGGLMGFREGPIDTLATDRAEQRRVRAYVAFARRWHDRLDAATRNGTDFRYAPGVQFGPQMDNVTNQLQAALSVMRDMVRRDAVKPLSERRSDATAAAGYLNAAGTVLTNLPR
jgi:hypothetical protein